jgi:hypothetical protein
MRRSRRVPLDSPGPTLEHAVIVTATPLDDVVSFVGTPEKLVAWFGGAIDAHRRTLCICLDEQTFVVTGLSTERRHSGRSLSLTGLTRAGAVTASVSLRTVMCHRSCEPVPFLGPCTEVRTRVALPCDASPEVIGLVDRLVRRGHGHLRAELGT